MKVRNKRIYHKDQAYLVKLREEYTLYGGWDTKLETGCLTIYAYKRRKPKKKEEKERKKRDDS